MKKLFTSDKFTPLLLLIITALLSFISWAGQKQVKSIESISRDFKQFQIETIKNNSKLDKTLELNQQWTHDVYNKEIHPNTMRSQKNEKDIIKIKGDVKNLKSILK